MFRSRTPLRSFANLEDKEILALAISLEEEHSRIYANYSSGLMENFPASGAMFATMAEEEDSHRRNLIELYQKKFGEHIPLIRPQDVKGFVQHAPIWLDHPLNLDKVRNQSSTIELQTRIFYERAQKQTTDASIRKLLGDLIVAERSHENLARRLGDEHLTPEVVESEEETRRRIFVLQVVQPGLAGLMDGSVSTLAPLFAAAFATHNTSETFLVGAAASFGAGVSMGFAEALSDDGELSGRGRPWIRGAITGLMTTIGGAGHTLPYLLSSFQLATTVAFLVVAIELWVIAWIRSKYMDTPFLQAVFEVVAGGLIVFLAGIAIGSA
jgi:rubrerythrin